MNTITILTVFSLLIFVAFLIYLMRPFALAEIDRWAANQRTNDTWSHFVFKTDLTKKLMKDWADEKPKLKPEGEKVRIDLPSCYIPACVGQWLKYKKHQWFVGVMYNSKSDFKSMWGNKGPDAHSVFNVFKDWRLFEYAKRHTQADTILVFHNHPMSISPHISAEDRKIAQTRIELAKRHDLNYIEFICKKGEYEPFESYFNSSFKTIEEYKNNFPHLEKRLALAHLRFRWESIMKF